MSVELFLIEYSIGGSQYCAHLPAENWEHAKQMADKIGAVVLGSNISSKPCIPAEMLMDFCNHLADEPIKWRYNSSEHLEALMAMGWPQSPEQL